MAIIKTATGVERTNLGGNTMITVGPSGAQVMQKSSNNRARGSMSRARQLAETGAGDGEQPQIPSPQFSALDQLIYFLDGTFDQLPPL